MRQIIVAFLTVPLAGCNATLQNEIGSTDINNLHQSDRYLLPRWITAFEYEGQKI
jgi:hypothetical protein